MPYIKSNNDRREKLQKGDRALSAGELNYQIFYYVKHHDYIAVTAIIHFVENFLGENPNYQKYNDMAGCLVCCAKEIKRRLNRDVTVLLKVLDHYDDEIAQYEEKKRVENSDVE